MAVVDDFKTRFPELVTRYTVEVVDNRIPVLMNDVPLYFGRPYDVPRNQPPTLNLLAHLLILDQGGVSGGGAAQGVIASKSAGSVSVSFAAKNDKSKLWDFFGSTKYGQAFIQMTSGIIGARFV